MSTKSGADMLERPAGLDESLSSEATKGRERTVSRLRLLWNRRRFLFRFGVGGLVLFTLIAFLIPKEYQSTTRLMPPDTQNSSGMALMAAMSARTGLGALGSSLLGVQSTGALFVGVLQSRTVADRLIGRFELKKVYGVSLMEKARKRLAENTSIAEDLKSGIITVTVTDRDPKRAAALAAAYVEVLNALVAELSTSAAHRERVFLEERLKEVQQDLSVAEKDLSQFSSKNATLDIKDQGRTMVEAAATLQGQLIAAQSELKGLEQIYSDDNVRVLSVRARISELQRQLRKLGGNEGQLAPQTANRELYPSIRQLPLLGVIYADLYRRTKVQEAVYETLIQEYELAKVQESKETPSVKVLDVANVPERKSFPPRLSIMVLGVFLATTVAVFNVLLQARWQEADPQHPTKQLILEIADSIKSAMPWLGKAGVRTGKWRARYSHPATRTEKGKVL